MLPDPRKLHNSYHMAKPFPHKLLMGAFDPIVLKAAGDEFYSADDERWRVLGHENVANKFTLKDNKDIPPICQMIIDELHSPRYIKFFEKMTGFRNLIGDPDLNGGGLHMIGSGGRLEVHADYNYHKKLKACRRLNVLIYLNDQWEEDWGGGLELWSRDMEECVRVIPPEIGNMVIFSTDSTSFHGHPKPLECPEGFYRKSLAIYLYQKGDPEEQVHGTLYQERG